MKMRRMIIITRTKKNLRERGRSVSDIQILTCDINHYSSLSML